jgi:transposase InsO family protein
VPAGVRLVAALVVGRRFRVMTPVDDFTRECLGLVVDTSLAGMRVARELDRIAELRNYSRMIVSDNGTELTSNAILAWQPERGVEWHYVAPGKPMQAPSRRQRKSRHPLPSRTVVTSSASSGRGRRSSASVLVR